MSSVVHDIGTENFKKIEVNREDCLVDYYPPSRSHRFSTLNLTPRSDLSDTDLEKLVRKEIQTWTEKYKYPLMLTVFSMAEDVVPQKWFHDARYILAWFDGASGELRLGDKDNAAEFDEAVKMGYPTRFIVFAGLPFSTQSERDSALASEFQMRRLGIRILKFTLFLWVGAIPAIWIITTSFGPYWLASVATIFSLFRVYKDCAKIFGWRKETPNEQAKNEEEVLMRHHNYHCLKNPVAFNRLKSENLRKELEEVSRAKFTGPE